MPTKEDIQRLRKEADDDAVFSYLSQQDAGFKQSVARVQEKNPNLGALEKARFNSEMINLYYDIEENKPENSFSTQMVASTMQNAQNKQEGTSYLGRTIRNVPESAGRFAGDIFKAVTNPFETMGGLADTVIGGGANTIETIAKFAGVENPEQLFNLESEKTASAVGDFFAERYGSTQAIKDTLENDPVGFIADLAGILSVTGAGLKGAGAIARNAGKVGKAGALSKVGQVAQSTARFIDPIENVARLARTTAKTGTFAVSQVTGLGGDTIRQIIDSPDVFTKAQQGGITRTSLASKMDDAITKLSDEVSDTGKVYQTIRDSGQVTVIPEGFFDDFLRRNAFEVGEDGKIAIGSNTAYRLSDAELSQLQRFMKQWKQFEGQGITANEFLNMRDDLTKISKFDKTAPSESLERAAKELRNELNAKARKGIAGLEDLDNEYGPIVENLNTIRKEFIDRNTGELKMSSVSKIANITGKGKELLRDELVNVLGKQFADDLFKEVNILKALEDVEFSNGTKVGTYTRSAIGGGAVVTGNIPLLAGAILASPSVAVKLLKAYGKTKGIANSTITKISNSLLNGEKLTGRSLKIVQDMLKEMDTAAKESIPLQERIED